MATFDETYDVIVVGGGNAGFSAATTAAQSGARVCLVEKAPLDDAGGNTWYTAAGYRCCFDGLEDLLPFLYREDGTKGLSQEVVDNIIMDPYTKADFHADIKKVTKGRADPVLANTLVDNSRAAIQWMVDNGAKFMLSFNRQAFLVDGKHKFWGGMVFNMIGQGKELFRWHLDLARRNGVTVCFDTPATELMIDQSNNSIYGIRVAQNGKYKSLGARSGVIIASGGFQASPALRTQYLGPGWDLAHVRGSMYNTGDGHAMAKAVGAKLDGNYSGCHSVAWDGNSPRAHGNRDMTNQYTKSGYPLGLMLNVDGRRFVDEGFDLRNFTYAVFGKAILQQPQGVAFQVWDSQGSGWLRKEEYADDVTTNLRSDTVEGLADILAERGLRDKKQFLNTISEFNEACKSFSQENPSKKFDPAIRDGMSTQGKAKSLPLGKTNWAQPIAKGPFQAVEVTCGITFTFGGLGTTPKGQVLSEVTRRPIEGLWCCGEILGGLFWDNYPGGSGLMCGTVMGRIAGQDAARKVKTAAKL